MGTHAPVSAFLRSACGTWLTSRYLESVELAKDKSPTSKPCGLGSIGQLTGAQ